eukprot:jgi/Mesen1/488/ME001024S10727
MLTANEAVTAQLEALRRVAHPDGDLHPHHGLEVLYSFAAIDPFETGALYFGHRLNIAYFSQFSAKFSMHRHGDGCGLLAPLPPFFPFPTSSSSSSSSSSPIPPPDILNPQP